MDFSTPITIPGPSSLSTAVTRTRFSSIEECGGLAVAVVLGETFYHFRKTKKRGMMHLHHTS
ncbi:MAG: hypothetical protein D3908_11200 [Candidatus Electrothrix sp. AUS4]|nr:hypothetical protein [Candidatus Electrothrix sp. AUS4]